MEKLPWLTISAASAWLSYLCQQKIHVVSDLASLPLHVRLENACVSYGLYFRRMILPFDLAAFYPHPMWNTLPENNTLLIPAVLSGVALLSVTGFVVWQIRRNPGLAVGWFWFLGTLVPMIGLVQVGRQQLADRYVYIPMIGLGLIAVTFKWPLRYARLAPGLAGIVLAFWFTVSFWQLGYWQNSRTLFSRAIEVTENNSWAHLNLGLALQNEGKLSEATDHYQRALEIDPKYALAHYNLGVVLHDRGRRELALQRFQQAITRDAGLVNAWIRMGAALGQMGQLTQAEECFRKAIELDKTSAQARFNLAIVLQAHADQPAALQELRHAVELDPTNIQFRTGCMLALAQAGRRQDAVEQARQIHRLDRTNQAARQILSSPESAH